jgi:hypothetical protein
MRKALIVLVLSLGFISYARTVTADAGLSDAASLSDAAAAVVDALAPTDAPVDAPTDASVDASQAPAAAPVAPAVSAAPDDLHGARRYGWAAVAFLLLVIATRLVAKLPVERLAFLRSGKNAAIVSAVGAVALSFYNALALGGSLVATVLAALTSLLHLLDAGVK